MHLLESTSPTVLARRLGLHKFQLCMMVLSELRLTYWGADAMYRLFERAQQKLQERQNLVSASSSNTSIPASSSLPPQSLVPQFGASTWDQETAHSAYLSNFAGEPDLELWDPQLNPFPFIAEDFENGPSLNLAFFQGEEGSANGCDGDIELNQDLTIDGANATMTFEQF
jgi:hypothetical protein